MNDQTSLKKVKCPQCGLLSIYNSENKFRPFCSERCRLIDLGQWADEGYRIPLKPSEGYQIDPEDFMNENSDLHPDKEE